MTGNIPITEQEMRDLYQVALGQKKADLAVINAQLINVYTGEIQENICVSVKGQRIALVDKDISPTIGQKTLVIDAKEKTLVPGFIDGHTHLSSWFSIHEFLHHAMKGGTTTIITETMETFPAAGLDGLLDFLSSLKDQPIKIFSTLPAMASISNVFEGLPRDILEQLIDRDDIIGFGESYWQAVFQNPEKFLPNFHTVLHRGKILEGHSAGARGRKLSAYTALGVSSCHEPITEDETLERLRLGLYVMVREGSIRRDLESISAIKDNPIDFRRLILSTDGISPADLLEKGYMEYLVQKAIDCGFNPVTAVQMATINVAEHFNMAHNIGGISPGKKADMVIISNPETIQVECVISNGSVISKKGRLTVSPRHHMYSPKSLNTVILPRKVLPDDFKISVSQNRKFQKVRIIKMVTELVTQEDFEELPVFENEIKLPERNGLSKVSAIDRARNPGKMFTGFIKGFGLASGAVACSAAWDTSCLIVLGNSDKDMALATNRIHQLQGGAVVCYQNRVICELALPVFGFLSTLPMEQVATRMQEINGAMGRLGVDFKDPLLSLITLTGAAIPYIRICEQGLVSIKEGKTVDLFV